MACVNVDNKASALTNTGEEAQSHDIGYSVVGPRISRKADEMVRVTCSTNRLIR